MTGFQSVRGAGVRAKVDGQTVLVGSDRFLTDAGVDPSRLADAAVVWEGEAKTVLRVAAGGSAVGAIALADVLKPHAREVVEALMGAGLRAEADTRNEKINYKVREHSLAKVPVILALGLKEVEGRTVSLRRLGAEHQMVLPLGEAVARLAADARAPDLRRAPADAGIPTAPFEAEPAS